MELGGPMVMSNRRKRERERKTNEIIDAAEKYFIKNGFTKTTLDEIANELELTKPALYRYFKNKEDLYLAVVLRGTQILSQMMMEKVEVETIGLEKILATGQAYWEFYQEYPDYCRLMLEARNFYPKCMDSSNLEKLTSNSQNYLGIMCDAIETGKKDGSIRPDIETLLTASYLIESTIAILRSSEMIKDVLSSRGMTEEDYIIHSLDLMGHAIGKDEAIKSGKIKKILNN